MSTTLNELIELVFLESGEFIVGNLEAINLDKDKFWLMTKRVLMVYNKYKPYKVTQNIEVSSGKYTYDVSMTYGIPSWISSVIPVDISNPFDLFYYAQRRLEEQIDEYSLLEIPRGFEWRYESPCLYVSSNGTMDVTEMHDHKYTETRVNGIIKNVTFDTMDDYDEHLIDLVTAKFLVAIGRSRRAFTLADLPITMDSDLLVSEGNELWNKSIEDLQNEGDWWEGIGQ
jgi:hypothetical protein